MGYPDDNPKTIHGTAKPGFAALPPVGLFHQGRVHEDGAAKYEKMNWRDDKVSASVYYNAMMRHLLAWWDGEENAADSGVHHLGHLMASANIILDAAAQGMLNDDRPTPGLFAQHVAEHVVASGEGPDGLLRERMEQVIAALETTEEDFDRQVDFDAKELAEAALLTGSFSDAERVIRSYLASKWVPGVDPVPLREPEFG